jgi:hypothetical protein
MPRKSSSRTKNPRSRRYRQNQNQQQNQQQNENQLDYQSENQNQNQNQFGGSNNPSGVNSLVQGQEQTQGAGFPISNETINQAAQVASKLLGGALQTGGSAGGLEGSALDTQDPGLKSAVVNGATLGAAVAAEGYTSLKGSPIVGGRKRKGRRSQNQKQNQNQNQNQNQKGGMVPGLLTAVETALVPLGLYLGQKALQSRRSGSRSLGKSFDFRRASRRTRRRR